jgi:hypothetical protein
MFEQFFVEKNDPFHLKIMNSLNKNKDLIQRITKTFQFKSKSVKLQPKTVYFSVPKLCQKALTFFKKLIPVIFLINSDSLQPEASENNASCSINHEHMSM